MEDVHPGICSWQWFSQRHGYDFYGTLVLEVVASSPREDARACGRRDRGLAPDSSRNPVGLLSPC